MSGEMVAAPVAKPQPWGTLKTVAVVSAAAVLAALACYMYRVEKSHRSRMKYLRSKYGPGLSEPEMVFRDVMGR